MFLTARPSSARSDVSQVREAPPNPSEDSSLRDTQKADEQNQRTNGLRALAETKWEDVSAEKPVLTELAEDQFHAWITARAQLPAAAPLRSSEDIPLEGFIKQCKRLLDTPSARTPTGWRRLRRWALTLIPEIARNAPDTAPWDQSEASVSFTRHTTEVDSSIGSYPNSMSAGYFADPWDLQRFEPLSVCSADAQHSFKYTEHHSQHPGVVHE